MPQLCGWFTETQAAFIKRIADIEGVSVSKVLSSLVSDALQGRHNYKKLERELQETHDVISKKAKQIATMQKTLDRYTRQILPPLKLLTESLAAQQKAAQEGLDLIENQAVTIKEDTEKH